MEEIVKKYIMNKAIMAALFVGENYLVEEMKENKEYETYLFNNYNLEYIRDIMKTQIRVFDADKIKTIKNAMKYYLENNNNIDSKKLRMIKEILNVIGLTKFKSNDKFYKLQYEIRNGRKCGKLTPQIREIIDLHILKDMKYLTDVYACISGEKVEIFKNDTDFLKSVNMFIDECPELLAFQQVENYIRLTLDENKKYKDNEELTKLNDSLLEYFDEIYERSSNLEHQVMQQSIFSLIFNSNISEILDAVKEAKNGDEFFNEQVLNIICEIIDMNEEKCMFDINIAENARELVLAFHEKGLLTNQKLNDLKRKLNIYMDEEYIKNNEQFYMNVFNNYNCSRYIIEDFNKFKKHVNILISNTSYFISQLKDFSIPVDEISYDKYTSMYVNYILNNYPLICEDILYIERIDDMVEYNYAYLVHARFEDPLFLNNNIKLRKKIKILEK